ncbi:hypothetical protein [Chroococcus sp. FPU101]|nr:hypothetical protein [Chroococcus sp. FPU101]GFE67743.1 hypothetical protein CFPU101_03530 [Chroococcus sp. FPU101]
MKIAVFSTRSYDRPFLQTEVDRYNHELVFLEHHLTPETASLAHGFPCIY